MKKATVIGFFLVFMFLVWKCGDRQVEQSTGQEESGVEAQPVRMEYVDFTFEQRKSKLAECAACHPEEMHNELIGPHAQSYVRLLEHLESSKTSPHYPRPYEQFLSDNEQKCVTCHAPSELFETVYYGLENENGSVAFTKENFPSMGSMPRVRIDEQSRLSGIDCLTCHYKEGRVITGVDYMQRSHEEPPCRPLPSKFFSSNASCFSCHFDVNSSMQDNIHNSKLNGDAKCGSCHYERGVDGAFTHYMFWRHDPENKDQFSLYQMAFEALNVYRSEYGDFLVYGWKNTSSPHGFSVCGELIAKIIFFNADSAIVDVPLYTRLNNKLEHDEGLNNYFSGEVPGIVGYSYGPNEPASFDSIPLEKSVVGVKVTGYQKSQYWLSDSLAQKVYSRTIKL